jgi:uncharacterized protein YutE (UPF0331/DUF86 family)
MIKEIHSKIKDLEKYVNLLKNYKNCSNEELERNLLLRGAVERYLQIALECVLEIGEMIISKEGFRKPEKYREVIEILGEEGVLPKDFAKRFAPAAGFRNILVHHYAEVDLDKLHKHLQKDLKDFDIFVRYVVKYLEKRK